jgi:hypothetical protein
MQNNEEDYQELYDYLDNFIATNNPNYNLFEFAISYKDLYKGKKKYNEMKKLNKVTYEIFGSNGMGYISFGLYKSKDGIIYLIVVNIQTPTNYILIDNEEEFGI